MFFSLFFVFSGKNDLDPTQIRAKIVGNQEILGNPGISWDFREILGFPGISGKSWESWDFRGFVLAARDFRHWRFVSHVLPLWLCLRVCVVTDSILRSMMWELS